MSTEAALGWTLVEAFVSLRPEEAARVVEDLPQDAAGALLDAGPPSVAALVVAGLTAASGAAALAACAPARGAAVLRRLPSGRAAALLRRIEPSAREALLDGLGKDAEAFRKAMSYPADTAGALMDPKILALPSDLTVREARRHVRRHSTQAEAHVCVVQRDGSFVGMVALSALVLREGATPLREVVDANSGRVGPMASRAAVIAHPAWTAQALLPVVDEAGLLVGGISAETRAELRGLFGLPSPRPAGAVAAGLAVGELYCVTAARLLAGIVGAPPTGSTGDDR